MNNDDLAEWNRMIEEARAAQITAQHDAIKSRGFKRRVYLRFARLFAWIRRKMEAARSADIRGE